MVVKWQKWLLNGRLVAEVVIKWLKCERLLGRGGGGLAGAAGDGRAIVGWGVGQCVDGATQHPTPSTLNPQSYTLK